MIFNAEKTLTQASLLAYCRLLTVAGVDYG
jgi:hypothetical protein